MDEHTFKGKRRMAYTDITDFTDYQGVGHDPLYKRYDSVSSIVNRRIAPEYRDFLAAPAYSPEEDQINWYIANWSEMPERYEALDGPKKQQYAAVKQATVDHYKKVLSTLEGEDFMVLASALKYIDDRFIYCADGKVHQIAWGMRPDGAKYKAGGVIVHELECIQKRNVSYDLGKFGTTADKHILNFNLPYGTVLSGKDIPSVTPEDGYEFTGWQPSPEGHVLEDDAVFRAGYRKLPPKPPVVPPVVPPVPPVEPPAPPVDPEPVPLKPAEEPAKKEKKKWWKRWWMWLLMGLAALLLLWLLLMLLHGCTSCGCGGAGAWFDDREENGVRQPEQITIGDEVFDNNGIWQPVPVDGGELPPDQTIIAPYRDENGELIPVTPPGEGTPGLVSNRFILFLTDTDDDLNAFAEDFSKTYPEAQYPIVGYDKYVKSLTVQFPVERREQFREELPGKIPNHKFLVLDEELYMREKAPGNPGGGKAGWHIDAVQTREAWKITKGSGKVIVGIVDDGFDARHPMFKDRVVKAYNVFTHNNRLGTGSGHGTHVAGLAAGSSDFLDKHATGVAPGCMIMPVQVFDNNLCTSSALIGGIMYAIHNGASVINVSITPVIEGFAILPLPTQVEIGQTYFKRTEELWNRVGQVAEEHKAIIVFSAGNQKIVSSIYPPNRPMSCVSVGAVDYRLYPSDFTNFFDLTDLSAPGSDIYSSTPGGNFDFMSGTSMAAPIVTGAIALMKSLNPDITATQARNVLYRTGKSVYGLMPPMIQIADALRGVQAKDYSPGKARKITPVPKNVPRPDNVPLLSWGDGLRDGTEYSIPTPRSGTEFGPWGNFGDDGGGNGGADPRWTNYIFGDGPVPDGPAVPAPAPRDNADDEYAQIRELIREYQKKITELEKRLPKDK